MVIAAVAGIYFFGFGSTVEYPNPAPADRMGTSTPVTHGGATTTPEIPVVEVSSTIPLPVPIGKICHPTGCSSQVCSDEDVVTDCMYREEYVCYQKATCERQKDGNCGWTETENLKACLLQYE